MMAPLLATVVAQILLPGPEAVVHRPARSGPFADALDVHHAFRLFPTAPAKGPDR